MPGPQVFDPGDAMRRINDQLMGRGAVILRPGISGTGKNIVRNVATGRPLLCCNAHCEKEGDNGIQIQIPHESPRFPGEKVIYIFCSHACRREFVRGTKYERLV